MDTFPHRTLTAIAGTPTPHTLKVLKAKLIANAMSVPSTCGGGTNRHLCLVLPTAEYYALTAVPFLIPAHPGQPPDHPAGATNAQIHSTNTTYAFELAKHKEYVTTHNALCTLLLKALPTNCYDILEDDNYGYANVMPLQILSHVQTTYCKITAKHLEKNRELLKAPWNPDDPITTLWTRIRNCKKFAAPYISTWHLHGSADHTFTNFIEHFTITNKVRIEELTSLTAGFHSANLAVPMPILPPTTPPAITNLAVPHGTAEGYKMFYCWTHGLSFSQAHTSLTCAHPADGHDITATLCNIRGGSTTFTPRNNNRNSQRHPGPQN